MTISFFISYFFVNDIEVISIKNLSSNIETLLSVSSIVFAVIGAWIALVYPSAIKSIISNINDIEANEKETNKLAELIQVAITSSLILVFLIILSLIENLIPENNKYINISLFTILTICSLLQIYSVFKVVLMNYHLLHNLRKKSIEDFEKHI